jgi:CBS domain-containing protein
MNIGDICTRDVAFVDHEETLQRAASVMRERHVGALVVTRQEGDATFVLGIVTDRDLVVEGVARGVDAGHTAIGRLASPGIASLPARAGLGEAIELMKMRGVRRLLVAAEDGHLHGIVSQDDLVAALGHEVAGLAHALRKGIDREAAERGAAPAPLPRVRVPAYRYA